MSLIMMLVVLVLFIILLLLSIISKKKILLYITVCLAVIVGLSYILMNTVFYYNADSIGVIKNDYDSFDIKVKNHQIRYAGSYVEFSCKYSKQKLCEELLKQYNNTFFDEKYNQIVMVSDNKIYTISECGSSTFLGNKKYKYILSREDVSIDISMEFLDIPFPFCAMISQGSLIDENVMLRCDFAHLKQYYENFTNVNIGDNTIEIMLEKYKCIITVNGEVAYFKIVKS